MTTLPLVMPDTKLWGEHFSHPPEPGLGVVHLCLYITCFYLSAKNLTVSGSYGRDYLLSHFEAVVSATSNNLRFVLCLLLHLWAALPLAYSLPGNRAEHVCHLVPSDAESHQRHIANSRHLPLPLCRQRAEGTIYFPTQSCSPVQLPCKETTLLFVLEIGM